MLKSIRRQIMLVDFGVVGMKKWLQKFEIGLARPENWQGILNCWPGGWGWSGSISINHV